MTDRGRCVGCGEIQPVGDPWPVVDVEQENPGFPGDTIWLRRARCPACRPKGES